MITNSYKFEVGIHPMKGRQYLIILTLLALVGCGAAPVVQETGHIQLEEQPVGDIPQVVQQSRVLPAPSANQAALETYSAVVYDLPVRELLFALARDANINVDIHPGISGLVTINAVNQTLPQILDRISRQVAIRYEWDGPNLIVLADTPELRFYPIDYVNIARSSTARLDLSSSVGATGSAIGGANGGSNGSTFSLLSESNNDFWQSLVGNVAQLLDEVAGEGTQDNSERVVVNVEAGILGVRGTSKEHAAVREFLDDVLSSVQRQVLIEATILEVELNDSFQSGVNWNRVWNILDTGTSFAQETLLTDNNAQPPFFRINTENSNLDATVEALSTFGDTRVLSSPRLMVLNNQSAVLKVVDEVVYFTVERDVTEATDNSAATTEYTTTIQTAPVGLVMSVTPQISQGNQVSLNVRPTISRIISFKQDPTTSLFGDGVDNLVPEIQVREMESILRVQSGQTAILGGLMQDDARNSTSGVPVASRLPLLGSLFAERSDSVKKTELVIFLRPLVIDNADINGDLEDYRRFLPDPNQANIREGTYDLSGGLR